MKVTAAQLESMRRIDIAAVDKDTLVDVSGMKKNILKATLVAAFALIAGFNVYNSQKPDVMSELALANVEALASNGESEGINWRGYYLDLDNSCCKIGRYSDECSGKYTTCGD